MTDAALNYEYDAPADPSFRAAMDAKATARSGGEKVYRRPNFQGKRAAMTEVREAILDSCSDWNWGHKTPDGPRYAATVAQVIRTFNQFHGRTSLCVSALAAHEAGDHTLYYQGSDTAGYVYLMFDYDAKAGVGSSAGCAALHGEIERRLDRTIYSEPSTGGTGIHAYPKLITRGYTAKAVNVAANHLQDYIRAVAATTDADVSGVDVNGTLPVYRDGWSDTRRKWRTIHSYTNGRLAKLPRQASDRPDEFLATATITVEEIMALRIPSIKHLPAEQKAKAKSGSGFGVTHEPVAKDITDRIPALRQLATRLMYERTTTSDAHVARYEDMAASLTILLDNDARPEKNGAMSQCRAERVWTELYDDGKINRPWNQRCWKACRDRLSDSGYIDWADNQYTPGENKNGQACRFKLAEEFVVHLLSVTGGASVSASGSAGDLNRGGIPVTLFTTPLPAGRGRPLRPVCVWSHPRLDPDLTWLPDHESYLVAA